MCITHDWIKKIFLVVFLIVIHDIKSQPVLIGMTTCEQQFNFGAIFQVPTGTSVISSQYNFPGIYGREPQNLKMCQASNGKLYGVTTKGGQTNYGGGVLFEFDPITQVYTLKANFDYSSGITPYGGLIEAVDGSLYGMTSNGGAANFGTIFKYNPVSNVLTKLIDFDGAVNGARPYGELVQAANGKMYGMTKEGGTNNFGVLFEFDPVTLFYTKRLDFLGASNGKYPYGSLIQTANGKLYGLTSAGGSSNQGALIEYDTLTLSVTLKYSFSGISLKGYNPRGSLLEASDGKLYGLTKQGGSTSLDWGVLFEFNPVSGVYSKKIAFAGLTTGKHPVGSLIQASDGKLYGYTSEGGISDMGTFFEYDILTTVLAKKMDFSGIANGKNPFGSPLQASDGKLYGVTAYGGSNDFGLFFFYDLSSSSYSKQFDFDGGAIGSTPYATLIKTSSNKLLGTTRYGGTFGEGTIIEYDPISGTCTKRADFSGATAPINPTGSLTQISNGRIFGLTSLGGTYNEGTLYEFDSLAGVCIKKFDFSFSGYSGRFPTGHLFEASDGKLYGMTRDRGFSTGGTLFQYDPVLDTLIAKAGFAGATTGSSPHLSSSLIQASNGKIYALTSSGGTGNQGTILEYDPISSSLSAVHNFTIASINGLSPKGALVEAQNGKLYGVANGGANLDGVIFEFDPVAHSYNKVADFNELTTGAEPLGSMIQASDGKLYGMTRFGGANGFGVLYQFDITSSVLSKKIDFYTSNSTPEYGTLLEYGVTSGLGVFDMKGKSQIRIFPNPSFGQLTIVTEVTTKISILNVLGESLFHKEIETTETVDVSFLADGIYFVRDETTGVNLKLVKHK